MFLVNWYHFRATFAKIGRVPAYSKEEDKQLRAVLKNKYAEAKSFIKDYENIHEAIKPVTPEQLQLREDFIKALREKDVKKSEKIFLEIESFSI